MTTHYVLSTDDVRRTPHYSLLNTCYVLLTSYCLLLTAHCVLLAICYSLLTVHCSVSATCYLLLTYRLFFASYRLLLCMLPYMLADRRNPQSQSANAGSWQVVSSK